MKLKISEYYSGAQDWREDNPRKFKAIVGIVAVAIIVGVILGYDKG